MQNTVSCKIEHHAILFALLAKEAILECGDVGKEAILEGMTTYEGRAWLPTLWLTVTS